MLTNIVKGAAALLGAVVHADAGTPADVLVIRAFVGVLESPPTAHVVNEDGREIRLPTFDVPDQPLQGLAAVDAQPAFPGICIGANNFHPASGRVLADGLTLVLDGVLLVLCGHPGVLRCSDGWGGLFWADVSSVVVHIDRTVDAPVPVVRMAGRGATVHIWAICARNASP